MQQPTDEELIAAFPKRKIKRIPMGHTREKELFEYRWDPKRKSLVNIGSGDSNYMRDTKVREFNQVLRGRKFEAAERKREIMRMKAEGMTQKEIAEQLGVSTATVSYHVRGRKRDRNK